MAEKQAIKVSDEEVKKIKDLRGSYQELIIQVGQAELQINDVREALDNIIEAKSKLLERYNEIKQTERTHLDQLNEKYGVGSLNVDTGLFTPADNAPPVKTPVETPVGTPPVEKQG